MKSLKRLAVIDIESTCWDADPPDGQQSEIIEIGVCLVDAKQLCRVDKRGILVKPATSKISDFCSKLTGITQADVDARGVTIDEAVEVLRRDFFVASEAWASYGDYDRLQMLKQLGDRFPFGTRHVNVKTMVGFALGVDAEVSLDEAMRMMGLQFEGRLHRGCDDAWNIAKIWIELTQAMRKRGGGGAAFAEHLARVSESLRAWPEWRRNMLGGGSFAAA